jgi:uncharacterized protein
LVMDKVSRSFQIFCKPAGAVCNLGCTYCYYLEKEHLFSELDSWRMPDDILEDYIAQHINASPDPVIRFSWHGGEPTVLGLDYFRRIVEVQRKHTRSQKSVVNGIQTNGTLLTDEWCRFLAEEGFSIGLSLDGPQEMHDRHRLTRDGKPTYEQAMRGYHLLRQHGMTPDILCVVNAHNVQYATEVYRFFKQIKARYIGFLPLVEPRPKASGGVSRRSVPAEAFGQFLCTIFDEWQDRDIGRIKVQIFEEAAKTALGQEHELCIFRPTCGDVPVLEHQGDFFSCDHFVDAEHHLGNIRDTPLAELLESPELMTFGRNKLDQLPRYCRDCEVLDLCHGECSKNRFIRTPDGEEGLNYLCEGYRVFFNHSRPFVRELANLWRRQTLKGRVPHTGNGAGSARRTRIGRNDPCPCGSGKKYKKCCLRKEA